jgi:phosphoribosylglycinamide formyltransferase-1
MQRIVIWASGKGSNAQALIEKSFELLNVEVVGLISDQSKAGALHVAEQYHIPSFIIDAKDVDAILKLLKRLSPDWSFLAGYMRIVPSQVLNFFKAHNMVFQGHIIPYRVFNVHPSLLPKYPGLRALETAFNQGNLELGVTIHFVDEGLDTGPIFVQESFVRNPGESFDEIKMKCHQLEHKLYCQALEWVNQIGDIE